MKKWVPLFLLLVFAHDIAIDAIDTDCQNKAGTAICHTCVCQTHFTPDTTARTIERVAGLTKYIPLPQPVLSVQDLSKAFFHPPKSLA